MPRIIPTCASQKPQKWSCWFLLLPRWTPTFSNAAHDEEHRDMDTSAALCAWWTKILTCVGKHLLHTTVGCSGFRAKFKSADLPSLRSRSCLGVKIGGVPWASALLCLYVWYMFLADQADTFCTPSQPQVILPLLGFQGAWCWPPLFFFRQAQLVPQICSMFFSSQQWFVHHLDTHSHVSPQLPTLANHAAIFDAPWCKFGKFCIEHLWIPSKGKKRPDAINFSKDCLFCERQIHKIWTLRQI